jgi:hypothetical protein
LQPFQERLHREQALEPRLLPGQKCLGMGLGRFLE